MRGTTHVADSLALREAWVDHPYYRYRGCAPDSDDPSRMAGNLSLPLGAHHAPDIEGGEPQRDRRAREAAAVEVCLSCPVMVQCDAYANAVTREGRLAEPDGIWGGRTALERHRAFIARRHEAAGAAVGGSVETPQKQRVLEALAAHAEPLAVAAAAGMDLRTANWQRSRLVTQLGLARTASRRELLAAAVERGLLDAAVVVGDDGMVPAIPGMSVPSPPVPVLTPLVPPEPRRRRRRDGSARRALRVPGQLAFDLSDLVLEDAA